MRGEPQRGFARRHLANEILDRLVHRRSAGPCTGEASPMVAEPATLPGDDGARLDEDQDVPPASPGPGQPRPEQSIGDLGAGPGRAPLVDGELVAQREDLELEGGRDRKPARRDARRARRTAFMGRRLPHLGGTHRESLAAVAFRETLLMTVASPFSGRTGRLLALAHPTEGSAGPRESRRSSARRTPRATRRTSPARSRRALPPGRALRSKPAGSPRTRAAPAPAKVSWVAKVRNGRPLQHRELELHALELNDRVLARAVRKCAAGDDAYDVAHVAEEDGPDLTTGDDLEVPRPGAETPLVGDEPAARGRNPHLAERRGRGERQHRARG